MTTSKTYLYHSLQSLTVIAETKDSMCCMSGFSVEEYFENISDP